MWPFKSKKDKQVGKEAAERTKKLTDEIINRRKYTGQYHVPNPTPPSRNDDIITDPLLSPLSSISPFYIGGQDSPPSYDSGSSHNDSSSYDSGSGDSGGSFDGGGSSGDF